MKKKISYLVILSIMISSCSAKKEIAQNVNENFYINQFTSKTEGGKQILNELVFGTNYIKEPTDIQKVLYDKFGKWNTKTYIKNTNEPILIWENISLFDHIDSKFTIASFGGMSLNKKIASVIVLNKNGADILSEKSPIKNHIAYEFSKLLRNKKTSNKFIKEYINEFHPYLKDKSKYAGGLLKMYVHPNGNKISTISDNYLQVNYSTWPQITYNKGGKATVHSLLAGNLGGFLGN
ncbi:hypothetical protein OD91_1054 [Lutibacter sp. Hel_I_33_5]|uniref:hypothetical protein n=1 Tax=Lutibacter sp. Hel_I_33_5 TaxID=1566289 RepID=UPI0011A6CC25|nr:hypothetical protein [Lutibacter sp. Hel_I_33_5]TVZ55787.1 hypothetical protein OD91_1054 [Lutibacter sp. Hel_I_33_5]